MVNTKSVKPKKTTVKFFLNKAVQPFVEHRIKRFPLYMLVTYERKNTMIKCVHGSYYKDLAEIDQAHYPGLLAFEENVISKTIALELAERAERFDLKGINKKYQCYSTGLHKLLFDTLKTRLWNILLRLEPFEYAKALNFNDDNITFNTLLVITRKIYPDFESVVPKSFEKDVEFVALFDKIYQGSYFNYTYPTIADWLDGSFSEPFEQAVKKSYAKQYALLKPGLRLIDDAVKGAIRLSLDEG